MPLSREAFAIALRHGKGRAMQHARQCGLAGLEDLVVEACLYNLAYDRQLERPRDWWVVEMADAGGALEPIARAVFARALEGEIVPEDEFPHDHSHRADVFGRLVQRGVSGAREAFDRVVEAFGTRQNELGVTMKLILDGADGLIDLARSEGRWMADNPDEAQNQPHWEARAYWDVNDYDEHHGEGAGLRVLASASSDPDVARYRDALLAETARMNDPNRLSDEPPPRPTAEEIVSHAPETLRRSYNWAKHVSDSQRLVLVEAMLKQSDAVYICYYLKHLKGAPAPRVDDAILSLLDHDDRFVRHWATVWLKYTPHPRIRAKALDWLSEPQRLDRAVDLLKSNLEADDVDRLNAALRTDLDADAMHHLGMAIRTLADEYPDLPLEPALRFAYEHTPCSDCRLWTVERLDDRDATPEWMDAEIREDANPGDPDGGDDEDDDDDIDNGDDDDGGPSPTDPEPALAAVG